VKGDKLELDKCTKNDLEWKHMKIILYTLVIYVCTCLY